MTRAARALARSAVALLGDPLERLHALRGVGPFVADVLAFRSSQRDCVPSLRLAWRHLHPRLADRFDEAARIDRHYFLQDIWVASRILHAQPPFHVDVGSRVDGFVAHLLCVRHVEVVDLRPLTAEHPRLHFRMGTLVALPYSNGTVCSLSCLHTLEHIGLGRYGDDIDPRGHERATDELRRVLAPGGSLYVSAPIGRERVEFNAHRVFAPRTVLDLFAGLELTCFAGIDDDGALLEGIDPIRLEAADYACGIFEFKAPEA